MATERLVLEGHDSQGNPTTTSLDVALQATDGSSTILGSSFGVPPPGGALVPLGRAYLQPGDRPTSWQSDSGMRNGVNGTSTGGIIWLSPKVSDAAWFPQLVTSFPADRLVLCSPWHEPENDATTGHDLTDYTTAYRNFRQAIDGAGLGARVTLLPILMKGKPETQNRQYLDAVRPYITALGYDAYNGGIQTPSTYQDPSVVFEKPLRLAAEYGLPLWIGETGTGLVSGDSNGQGRITWTKAVVAHLKANGVRGASWWSQGALAWNQTLFNAWVG